MTSERIQRRIENLLDEADAALVERDWATVLDRAQTVLALDPDNADAQTFLAAAERSLGNSAAEPVAPSTAAHVAPKLPTATAVPTSFANGRYQVKEFLGEGGRKRVYLVHDSAPLIQGSSFMSGGCVVGENASHS